MDNTILLLIVGEAILFILFVILFLILLYLYRILKYLPKNKYEAINEDDNLDTKIQGSSRSSLLNTTIIDHEYECINDDKFRRTVVKNILNPEEKEKDEQVDKANRKEYLVKENKEINVQKNKRLLKNDSTRNSARYPETLVHDIKEEFEKRNSRRIYDTLKLQVEELTEDGYQQSRDFTL